MNARVFFAAMVVAAVLAPQGFADGFPGLSLRVPDESAPAGSIVQIKVEVTEPKPISTGRGKIKVRGLTTVEGIVLMNHDQDTYGVAMVDGDELSFSIQSPSSLFGTPNDYPILGIAGKVDPSASLGTRFPLQLEPNALQFRDPNGGVYAYELQNGELTVANGVTIGDVSPGSTVVPAGGTVRITGANFRPDTRIRLHEVSIASMHYIDSTRIDVVLAQSANMHGMRVRARNEDKSESEYFSYQRTRPVSQSSDEILARTVPLFAPVSYTTATIRLPRTSSARRRAVSHALSSRIVSEQSHHRYGFALQNLGSNDASASIELLDSNGHPYATNTMTIGPDRYLVREISEVFGSVTTPSFIRMTSTAPLQILGLIADPSTNAATAIPPS